MKLVQLCALIFVVAINKPQTARLIRCCQCKGRRRGDSKKQKRKDIENKESLLLNKEDDMATTKKGEEEGSSFGTDTDYGDETMAFDKVKRT
jgi:hypothetical protein